MKFTYLLCLLGVFGAAEAASLRGLAGHTGTMAPSMGDTMGETMSETMMGSGTMLPTVLAKAGHGMTMAPSAGDSSMGTDMGTDSGTMAATTGAPSM